MPFLSPAKLLVILVVALVVLGPDKLPKVAKQIGGLWGDFRRFREKLETDVRGSFPDLPSTDTITRAVRSPMSFLDKLADTHAPENAATSSDDAGTEPYGASGDAVRPPPSSNRPAGAVTTTDGEAGVVHQVRTSGIVIPDDPGMN